MKSIISLHHYHEIPNSPHYSSTEVFLISLQLVGVLIQVTDGTKSQLFFISCSVCVRKNCAEKIQQKHDKEHSHVLRCSCWADLIVQILNVLMEKRVHASERRIECEGMTTDEGMIGAETWVNDDARLSAVH